MSKHTKGPWGIEMNDNHAGSIATVYGCADGYANVWSENWVDTDMAHDEREANLRLIAAAPDLYEAVAAVIDATRDYLPPNGITKDEFISRVIAATDNTRMAEIMK